MIDLNSPPPVGSGWQLEVAAAIDDSGQVVGYGLLNGQTQAFLLDTAPSPSAPEPGTSALIAAALASLMCFARKR